MGHILRISCVAILGLFMGWTRNESNDQILRITGFIVFIVASRSLIGHLLFLRFIKKVSGLIKTQKITYKEYEGKYKDIPIIISYKILGSRWHSFPYIYLPFKTDIKNLAKGELQNKQLSEYIIQAQECLYIDMYPTKKFLPTSIKELTPLLDELVDAYEKVKNQT